MSDLEIDIEFFRKMERVMGDEIDKLRAERDAAVKALERIKNHVDTDEYAYEIAVAAIDAARGGM